MKTKDTMSSELTMANWLNEVHTSMPKSRNKSTVRKDWNEKPSVLWKSSNAKYPSVLWKTNDRCQVN